VGLPDDVHQLGRLPQVPDEDVAVVSRRAQLVLIVWTAKNLGQTQTPILIDIRVYLNCTSLTASEVKLEESEDDELEVEDLVRKSQSLTEPS